MTPRQPVDVVRDMYAAFEARDEPRLRTLIHSKVEWNQCEGFPGGARHRGVDAVLAAVFGANRTTWTGFRAPVEEYVAAGERVVAIGHYTGTHATTGTSMRAVFAHVYVVRDSRIVRFDQIADTWPMVAAADPEPDPQP